MTRKNRATGSIISAELDDFLGWITVCQTHGQYAEHRNKTAAVSWTVEPAVWCSGCAEVIA